jgi:hypothetical protein
MTMYMDYEMREARYKRKPLSIFLSMQTLKQYLCDLYTVPSLIVNCIKNLNSHKISPFYCFIIFLTFSKIKIIGITLPLL